MAPGMVPANHRAFDVTGRGGSPYPPREAFSTAPGTRFSARWVHRPTERTVERMLSRAKAWHPAVAGRLIEPARIAGITVLGPQPCPISRISRFWRYHLLLKAPSARALLHFFDGIRADLAPPGNIQMAIDVDPQSTL